MKLWKEEQRAKKKDGEEECNEKRRENIYTKKGRIVFGQAFIGSMNE